MAIIIYGQKTSVDVQKVLWTLMELELDFEHKDIGKEFESLDSKAFLDLSPHGLSPVLTNKDTVLWESNTITRYLVANYGKRGFFRGRKSKILLQDSQAEQWINWGSFHLKKRVHDVFTKTILTAPKQQNRKEIEESGALLNKEVERLDFWLGDQPFVLGDKFTVADIGVGSNLYRYYAMDFERPQLKQLRRYFDQLLERKAFSEAVVVSFESLRVHNKDVPDAGNTEKKALINIENSQEIGKKVKLKGKEVIEKTRETIGKGLTKAKSWISDLKG